MIDFKSQLQALVDQAARTQASDREQILRNSVVKHYSNDFEYTANYFGRIGGFKAGCDFLMPVLMRAIEQRDHKRDCGVYYPDEHNKELLNVLKGEGK